MTDATMSLPARFASEQELEDFLSTPNADLIADLAALDGDVMILGAAGKMGPSMALLAQRAVAEGGLRKRIIAVSRFSTPGSAEALQRAGVETISADLIDAAALRRLPDAPNIVFMVGHKFGATGQEPLTWAINSFLPGLVTQRFPGSRMVAFSSGNIYPFVPTASGGCMEETAPAPVGEYAQSVLGRERIMQHFAQQLGIDLAIYRLNYAVEMRYGVLLDVATKVAHGEPVDLTMGYANVIWQGDANAYALRCLKLATRPPLVLNITGPETISVRQLAERFGRLLGREPILQGTEAPTALLNNAQRAHALLGYPRVPLGAVIGWVADWVKSGGATLGKPTKFQVRDGRF